MTRIMLAFVCLLLVPAISMAGDEVVPTPDEMVAAMEAQCAANSEAMATRQAGKPLYERLGGDEKIHALTKEVVRLHTENEALRPFVEGVDGEKLAYQVAQFIISGTGGEPVYEGRTLEDSHRHMRLTNQDFLNAGSDVIQAMQNLGYGQEEIDEMVCIFVSLRSQVVLDDESGAGR